MSLVLISDIFLVVIALVSLIIASITDIKKREVADWLSFSLIAVALVTRLLVAILDKNVFYFVYALIAGAVVFLLVILLYYSKALGGGDAKLLIALGCCFATTPSFLSFNYNVYAPLFNFSIAKGFFLFDFFVNCLFVGLVYGLVFSIIMAIKYRKNFSMKFKSLAKKTLIFQIIFIIMGLIFLIFSLVKKIDFLLVLSILLIVFPYLFIFIKSVETSGLIKLKSWKQLTEGDWLVQQIRINKKIIKPSADGLSKKDIQMIKVARKKVLIRDGMPFVPVFLISAIISLLVGNLLFILLGALI